MIEIIKNMSPRIKKIEKPRLRMAPSPTGWLHIGNARVFLFNWIIAKKYQGKLILRIEDTDKERANLEYENDILESLKWLGINWDEGPYRQSQRGDIYKKYLHQLLEEKKAYYCFCSQEELDAKKEEMISRGEVYSYDGKCRNLSEDEIKKNLESSDISPVIRLKMPEKKNHFNDLIRGKIEFDLSLIGDIVIAKNIDYPLYNFANVIDDAEMKITHIIRGEDHISNTPKQLAIYEAIGWSPPEFGHLPLILSSDKSKMSKRFGSVAVKEYRENGYLPEAMVNFLVFLGWHPTEEKGIGAREVLSIEEIIEQFEIDKIQKSGAVFNPDKLDWINGEHIKLMDIDDLVEKAIPFIDYSADREFIKKIILIHLKRIKKLSDLRELTKYFFELPDYKKDILVWKNSSESEAKENLIFATEILSSIDEGEFNQDNLEKILMPEAEKRGRGEFLWPLRVALSGEEKSASPFEILDVLGKNESLRRIRLAVNKLR